MRDSMFFYIGILLMATSWLVMQVERYLKESRDRARVTVLACILLLIGCVLLAYDLCVVRVID